MSATSQAAPHGVAGTTAEDVWELLRTLFRQQRRRFLIAAAELKLHPAQAGALLHLDEPMPMNELASQLGCDNSNVTGLIDRLEARGLVAREPSAQDRRVKHVVLTAQGRRVRRRMLAQIGRPPGALTHLPADDRRELARLLADVVADEPA